MTLQAPATSAAREPRASGSDRRWTPGRAWIAGFVLILAVAAVMRFYHLGQDDYWLDEFHSLASSAGKRAEFELFTYGRIVEESIVWTDLDNRSTLGAAWRSMRHDSHPPLYFMTLLLWRRALGDTEAAVRSLSAGMSVLSIVPVILLLSAVGRHRAGLLAGLILAVSFAHIRMAQEARPYSMSIFITSSTYLLLVLAEPQWSTGTRRARFVISAAYGASLYLAVLTHYFAGLALLGHVAYAAVRLRGPAFRLWAVTALAAALAAAGTWLVPFVAQVAFIRTQPWLAPRGPDHLWQTLLRLTDLPIRLLLQTTPFKTFWWQSAAGFLLLGGSLLLLARKWDRAALACTVWFVVPALLLFALDLATHKELLKHLRYPAVAVPGMAGLVALALDRLRTPLRWTALIGLLVAVALRLELPASAHPHARAAAEQLRAVATPEDLVIYDAVGWPIDWIPQFHAPIVHYLGETRYPTLLLREPMADDLKAQVQTYPRIIVISPRIDAVPNPSPGTHRPVARSEYIFQVGWFYVFVKQS